MISARWWKEITNRGKFLAVSSAPIDNVPDPAGWRRGQMQRPNRPRSFIREPPDSKADHDDERGTPQRALRLPSGRDAAAARQRQMRRVWRLHPSVLKSAMPSSHRAGLYQEISVQLLGTGEGMS